MSINFHLAAKRHWDDATLLESNVRIPNAGQLYGLSAECGIKAVLIGLGYPINLDGSPPKIPPGGTPKIREHVNILANSIAAIQLYAHGRNGAKYTAMLSNISDFADWNVDHRYYDESAIPHSLSAWQIASAEVMKMVDSALLDGVLK